MDTNFMKVWQDVCNIIKREITEVSYNTWIKPIEPVSIENDKIDLCTSSDFSKAILDDRYGELIKNALRIVTSKEFQINIITISNNKMQKSLIRDEVNKKYEFVLNPAA